MLNLLLRAMLAAHERVYGTDPAQYDPSTASYSLTQPSSSIQRARRSLMLSWVTRDVSDPDRVVKTYMVEGIGPVCAEFAKAAYDFRDWTWNTMRAAAQAGSLQVDADMDAAGVSARQLVARDAVDAETAITWWVLWLRLEDQMSNEPVIVHP